jgi:hypothetical protein
VSSDRCPVRKYRELHWRVSSGMLVAVPITKTYYRIETSDRVYVLVFAPGTGWHNRRPDLVIHGHTKIAIDGQNARILDESGKEVKMPIVEKIAK